MRDLKFAIPTYGDPEVQRQAIELQASIARGDRHLYIVAENNGKDVKVVHFAQLLKQNIETSLNMFDAYPEFTENYPVGSLCWLMLREEDWECAPVTNMDAKAREEYEFVLKRLFGDKRDIATLNIERLQLKGKNPRQQ